MAIQGHSARLTITEPHVPTPTTQEAFLRAIAAEPDENSHRLVYADWLDEEAEEGRHHDPGRAEFVRAECGIRPNVCTKCDGDGRINQHHDPAGDTWRGGKTCPECHGDGKRGSALIAVHDARWRCGPSGGAGGLKRTFDYPSEHNNGFVTRGELVRLTYDRGFVRRVTVPALAHLVGNRDFPSTNCPGCHGSGAANRHRGKGPSCGVCGNHDLVTLPAPTPWLAAVSQHWPTICEAVALDRVPHVLQTGKAIWHQQGPTTPAMSEVPNCLLSADVVLTHPTATAAATALGRATMTWARSHVVG